jgi:hypothetical protein
MYTILDEKADNLQGLLPHNCYSKSMICTFLHMKAGPINYVADIRALLMFINF